MRTGSTVSSMSPYTYSNQLLKPFCNSRAFSNEYHFRHSSSTHASPELPLFQGNELSGYGPCGKCGRRFWRRLCKTGHHIENQDYIESGIAERRKPQSGKFMVMIRSEKVEFRVEETPTAYDNENCVGCSPNRNPPLSINLGSVEGRSQHLNIYKQFID
jgi:hypothetical protein